MIDELTTNYVRVIKRYSDFDGRASRKEYWMYVLANLIVHIVLNVFVIGLFFMTTLNASIVSTLYMLAVLVPSIAVGVRRLHDTDRTGWWELLCLLPIVGSIPLLVIHCLPGSAGENRFGSRPKEITANDDDAKFAAEKAEQELEKTLNKLKDSWVSSLSSEKQLEMELQKKVQEHLTWEKRAATAVNGNNDELAKQCLAKKLEANMAIQAYTAQLQTLKEANAGLKAKYTEMQEQLRVFRLRKSNLEARSQTASSQEAVNNTRSSSSAMDKFEEKIRAQDAMNEAKREMARGTAALTAEKFSDVEDELSALKKLLKDKQTD